MRGTGCSHARYLVRARGGSPESYAELLSLILIVASFVAISYVFLRVRRRRSFQFEMFLFTIVPVAAEIPRTLYSVGLVNLDALSTFGLGIHSVSMVILTTFVAFRTYGFFRGKTIIAVPGDQAGLVLRAAQDALAESMGEPTSRAMNFYIDIHLLLSDPTTYDSALRKFLGEGAIGVESVLMDSICKHVGLDRAGVTNLEDLISKAKGKRT